MFLAKLKHSIIKDRIGRTIKLIYIFLEDFITLTIIQTVNKTNYKIKVLVRVSDSYVHIQARKDNVKNECTIRREKPSFRMFGFVYAFITDISKKSINTNRGW